MTSAAQILVVDDEASIRFFLSELLTEEGYAVALAETAEAGLHLMASQPIDLALVDLNLPGMSGMELIKVLHARWPAVVIIVLTAYASLETAVEALRQGAHDYLFKPSKALDLRVSVQNGLVKRQEQLQHWALVNQLNALTSSAAPNRKPPALRPPVNDGAAEASLRFIKRGRLFIDLLRHTVTLDGCMLELSPTEFSLLAFLADEYPKVVSAKTLVHAVHGYDVTTLEASDVLRYHIHRIRLKVRQATGQANLIRTVRGVGYTLNEA